MFFAVFIVCVGVGVFIVLTGCVCVCVSVCVCVCVTQRFRWAPILLAPPSRYARRARNNEQWFFRACKGCCVVQIHSLLSQAEVLRTGPVHVLVTHLLMICILCTLVCYTTAERRLAL